MPPPPVRSSIASSTTRRSLSSRVLPTVSAAKNRSSAVTRPNDHCDLAPRCPRRRFLSGGRYPATPLRTPPAIERPPPPGRHATSPPGWYTFRPAQLVHFSPFKLVQFWTVDDQEQRQRFYYDARHLLEMLADVGFPSVAHHLLKTLGYLVPFDPPGIFLTVG